MDLDPASPTYGYITTTPKPGWKHTDVLGPLRAVDPSAPILFDTDVNVPRHGHLPSWQLAVCAIDGSRRPATCAWRPSRPWSRATAAFLFLWNLAEAPFTALAS